MKKRSTKKLENKLARQQKKAEKAANKKIAIQKEKLAMQQKKVAAMQALLKEQRDVRQAKLKLAKARS